MQTNAIEKIKEVFAELESSTVLEQLRAEKARKTLAEREAAAARIKAAEAELEKSLPVLQAKVEAAEAALKAHDEKRKALAEKVKKMTESESEIIYIPYEKAYDKGFEDMKHRKPNIEKLKKQINYRPLNTTDDILKDVMDHFKG